MELQHCSYPAIWHRFGRDLHTINAPVKCIIVNEKLYNMDITVRHTNYTFLLMYRRRWSAIFHRCSVRCNADVTMKCRWNLLYANPQNISKTIRRPSLYCSATHISLCEDVSVMCRNSKAVRYILLSVISRFFKTSRQLILSRITL